MIVSDCSGCLRCLAVTKQRSCLFWAAEMLDLDYCCRREAEIGFNGSHSIDGGVTGR